MAANTIDAGQPPGLCRRDVLAFCWRTCLFGLPMLLVLTPPLTILQLSGEFFRPVADIVSETHTRSLLVGYSRNEQNSRFLKFSALRSLPRQSVIAVGSSRVLSFRSEMFSQPFYNAGFMAVSLQDLTDFVDALPDDKLPEVLLIGLDQWMFHPWWEQTKGGVVSSQWNTDYSFDLQSAIAAVPETYRDLFRGEISLGGLLENRRTTGLVGLNAIMHRSGFRNDGSYEYGEHTEQLLSGTVSCRDYGFRETLSRVATGRNRFEWSSRLSDTAVADTSTLLQKCAGKGIHVVAFLPPFADTVFDAMMASGNYQYVNHIVPALSEVFRQYSAELHAFQNMAACGSLDSEAIDGFHGGEVTYLRILNVMAERNSRIRRFVAPQQIALDLANRRNCQQVYDSHPSRIARGGEKVDARIN